MAQIKGLALQHRRSDWFLHVPGLTQCGVVVSRYSVPPKKVSWRSARAWRFPIKASALSLTRV